jgi:hypothetical protein
MLRPGFAVMLACLSAAACGPKPAASTAPPAAPSTATVVGHETDLLRITLTPEAEIRLGLKTAAVGEGSAALTRTVHGEIVAPPRPGGVPTNSTTDLVALGANQARTDGDVARTRSELEVAQKAYNRAAALVQEEAGSVRARDEAEAALGVARANYAAAQQQRALYGPAVAAMGRQDVVWVRAAAFASDLDRVDRTAPAQVRTLGPDGVARSARPTEGPPSANLVAGTVDLYYTLPNTGAAFRVGQRVAVDLPVRGQRSGLAIPASAVLRDIYGGEWVYVRTAPRAYERRRVELGPERSGEALVTRGLTSGAQVVIAGAMELFGAEFGSK